MNTSRFRESVSERNIMTPHSDPSSTNLPSLMVKDCSLQPKSEYLREILAGKKAERMRADSSTRSPAESHGLGRDDWILSLEEEDPRKRKMRPSATRRASVQENAGLLALDRGMGHKEMLSHADKLEKENFDLKLRIRLQEDRMARLDTKLEEASEKLKHAEEVERQKARLEEESGELLELNDQLVKELEKRDGAVEEAANMIQELESKVETLERTLADMRRLQIGSEASSRPSTGLQDSDYFSAGSLSPNFQVSERPYTARMRVLAKPSFYSITTASSFVNPSVQSLDTPVPDDESSVDPTHLEPPRTPRPVSRRLENVRGRNEVPVSFQPPMDIPARSHSLNATGFSVSRPAAVEAPASFLTPSPTPAKPASAHRPTHSKYEFPGQRASIALNLPQPSRPPQTRSFSHNLSTGKGQSDQDTNQTRTVPYNQEDDVFTHPPSPTASSDPTESSFSVARDWGGPPKYAALPRNNAWVGTRDLMFNGDGIDDFMPSRGRRGREWRG